MRDSIPKYVTQARAAFLLGMPVAEIHRISLEAGLGHLERAGNFEELYLTYDELKKVCALASEPAMATH